MDADIRKTLNDNLTVNVDVAGKAIGVSRNTAYAATKSGDLPSVRIGGRIRVPTAALRKMLGIES